MTDPDDPFALRVECHAGGRGDELPRVVHLGGTRHAVTEILDRWNDAGVTRDLAVRRIFKLRLDSGDVVLVEQDAGTHAWTLRGFGMSKP
jgi:hypothetical protein